MPLKLSIFGKSSARKQGVSTDLADALQHAKLLYQGSQFEAAAAAYRSILDRHPQDWESVKAAASIALERDDGAAALLLYDEFIGRCAGHAEAHYKRANVFAMAGSWERALADYDQAIALDPTYANAHCNRGTALEHLSRWDEALASFDRALTLNPQDFLAYYNRGSVLRELKRLEEALASYDRSLALKNDYFEAHFNRGNVLMELRRFGAAAASYSRALELNSNHKYLLGLRRFARMHTCDWSNLNSDLARLTDGLEALQPVSPPLPLLALFDSAHLHRLAAEIFVREECPSNDSLGEICLRQRRAKIRIGYFSADFRNHALSMLAAELFELHDRTRFEITGFAFGPEATDPMRMRLQRAFDHFVDVRDRSDLQVAALAREMKIDIAVDLGGFTEHHRTNIFASRAAPIQMSYLGYLGTMGAPYMDYLLADATLIPADQQSEYSEKIIYLPSYQVNDSKRVVGSRAFSRGELGLPPTGFVFCCINSAYKISPEVFESWTRILRGVPDSCLFLVPDNEDAEQNLRNAARAADLDPRRLVFGKRIALEDYFARFAAMDLFLDTLPYNAGTIASDALRTGLPVLTCCGRSFASRVAASVLTAIDMQELITSTLEQYEKLAVELALNPARLVGIRQRLTRHLSSKRLFATDLFTRSLEQAFERIFERCLEGLPPEHLHIGS